VFVYLGLKTQKTLKLTVFAAENASRVVRLKSLLSVMAGSPLSISQLMNVRSAINVQMFVPNPYLSQSKESLGKPKHISLISVSRDKTLNAEAVETCVNLWPFSFNLEQAALLYRKSSLMNVAVVEHA
tara:strand:- start:233 stop:616 length:384 start_codon:yes stop_codon:yes gene_type:complete